MSTLVIALVALLAFLVIAFLLLIAMYVETRKSNAREPASTQRAPVRPRGKHAA
jgi:hypothetical protein